MSSPEGIREIRVTVLLIDDQTMIGEAVRRMLAEEPDVDFHYCSDPTQALVTAARVRPTVILSDLVMPVLDGLLLVRFLRANPATRDVPIIVLSGREEPLVKAEAFALGANDYVVKLPDRLELVARIRYHSWGYINHLQRDEAYAQLEDINARLEESNSRFRRMSAVVQGKNVEIERQKAFIQRLFGRYLSEEIVESLISAPEGVAIGGEKRVVTVLMSDLRGFTSTCQALDPAQVVRMLNIYLGRMAEIILAARGTIDEFIGDAILAIFGAPIFRDDDAARAVGCALEMQRAMPAVNLELVAAGLPSIEMGIAVNTGEVVVGNIGSHQRSKYGVVGSPVNLTARIEAQTTGSQVLISETTVASVGAERLLLGAVLEVAAKGFTAPVRAYELLGRAGDEPVGPTVADIPRPLAHPVDVCLARVDKETKSLADERLLAAITALSSHAALISCEAPLAVRADVCLWLGGDARGELELYAKVVAARVSGELEIRFTAVPAATREAIERLLAGVMDAGSPAVAVAVAVADGAAREDSR